ncbi:hypothetical protein COCVIDRAFT_97407, partial [Bipolaris victoriae FI3]
CMFTQSEVRRLSAKDLLVRTGKRQTATAGLRVASHPVTANVVGAKRGTFAGTPRFFPELVNGARRGNGAVSTGIGFSVWDTPQNTRILMEKPSSSRVREIWIHIRNKRIESSGSKKATPYRSGAGTFRDV